MDGSYHDDLFYFQDDLIPACELENSIFNKSHTNLDSDMGLASDLGQNSFQVSPQELVRSEDPKFIFSDSGGHSMLSEPVYCICRGPENGMMIECSECRDWFHITCVGISKNQALIMENYYCPRCASVGQHEILPISLEKSPVLKKFSYEQKSIVPKNHGNFTSQNYDLYEEALIPQDGEDPFEVDSMPPSSAFPVDGGTQNNKKMVGFYSAPSKSKVDLSEKLLRPAPSKPKVGGGGGRPSSAEGNIIKNNLERKRLLRDKQRTSTSIFNAATGNKKTKSDRREQNRNNLLKSLQIGIESDKTSSHQDDNDTSSDRLYHLASNLEEALWNLVGPGNDAYNEQLSCIRFNLSVNGNESLRNQLLSGKLPVSEFVRMSNDEMAPKSLLEKRKVLEKLADADRMKEEFVPIKPVTSPSSKDQDQSLPPAHSSSPFESQDRPSIFVAQKLQSSSHFDLQDSPFSHFSFSALHDDDGGGNNDIGDGNLRNENCIYPDGKNSDQSILVAINSGLLPTMANATSMEENGSIAGPNLSEKSLLDSTQISGPSMGIDDDEIIQSLEIKSLSPRTLPTLLNDNTSSKAFISDEDNQLKLENDQENSNLIYLVLGDRPFETGDTEGLIMCRDLKLNVKDEDDDDDDDDDTDSNAHGKESEYHDQMDTAHYNGEMGCVFETADGTFDNGSDIENDRNEKNEILSPTPSTITTSSSGDQFLPAKIKSSHPVVWCGMLIYRGIVSDFSVQLRRITGPRVEKLFKDYDINSWEITGRVDLENILEYLKKIESSSSRTCTVFCFEPDSTSQLSVDNYHKLIDHFCSISRAGVVSVKNHSDVFVEIYICPVSNKSAFIPNFLPKLLLDETRLWLLILTPKSIIQDIIDNKDVVKPPSSLLSDSYSNLYGTIYPNSTPTGSVPALHYYNSIPSPPSATTILPPSHHHHQQQQIYRHMHHPPHSSNPNYPPNIPPIPNDGMDANNNDALKLPPIHIPSPQIDSYTNYYDPYYLQQQQQPQKRLYHQPPPGNSGSSSSYPSYSNIPRSFYHPRMHSNLLLQQNAQYGGNGGGSTAMPTNSPPIPPQNSPSTQQLHHLLLHHRQQLPNVTPTPYHLPHYPPIIHDTSANFTHGTFANLQRHLDQLKPQNNNLSAPQDFNRYNYAQSSQQPPSYPILDYTHPKAQPSDRFLSSKNTKRKT